MPKVLHHRSRFNSERRTLDISEPKSFSSHDASSTLESTSSETLYSRGVKLISQISHCATKENQDEFLAIIQQLSTSQDLDGLIDLYNQINARNKLTSSMLNAFLKAAFENTQEDFALHIYDYAVVFSKDNPHNPLTNTDTHEIIMYHFLEADSRKMQFERMHDFYKNAIAIRQMSRPIFEMMYYTAFLSSKLPIATLVLAYAVKKNQSTGAMISHSQRMGLFQNMSQPLQNSVKRREEASQKKQQLKAEIQAERRILL